MAISDEALPVLQAYSRGEITWRNAAQQLMLDQYAELAALLKEAKLPVPMPSAEKEAQEAGALKALFMRDLHHVGDDGQEG